MSGLKEIRRRITSVSNTKQITRAMKLVSAAKLRRAQDAALGGRDYSDRLNSLIRELARKLPDGFTHPLLSGAVSSEGVPESPRQIIVISGERGLCGGYNTNIIKAVQEQEITKASDVRVIPVGRRSVSAVRRLGWETASCFEGLSENAFEWPFDKIVGPALRDFSEGKCSEVILYYTKFVSAVNQEVTREVLLPFGGIEGSGAEGDEGGKEVLESLEVQYSPSAEEIFSKLIPQVVKSRVLQAGFEAKASEHAARMTAMDAATNNATELIDKLRLHYNRARQSTITTELIDIIGGAEAIN